MPPRASLPSRVLATRRQPRPTKARSVSAVADGAESDGAVPPAASGRQGRWSSRAIPRRTKASSLAALRAATERLGHPPRRGELEFNLRRDLIVHFGSLERARRAARISSPKRATKWSKERVVARLRELAALGVPITCVSLIEAGHHAVLGAATKYVGGLIRARELANIEHPVPRRRSDEMLTARETLAEIRRRHRVGEPVAISRTPSSLVNSGIAAFGSWRAAVEAAGIDYESIMLVRRHSPAVVLARLHQAAARVPMMTLTEFARSGLKWQCLQHFGSVERALAEAGLVGWPTSRVPGLYTKAQVAAMLRARARAGAALYRTAVQRDDRRLAYSVLQHYGSFQDVYKHLGLVPDRPPRRA